MTSEEYKNCVHLYAKPLYRFLLKKMKDKAKAEDILHDTYVKLLENLDGIESRNAKSYMFTSAYNRMIDAMRQEKKQVSLDEMKEGELPEQSTDERFSDSEKTILAAAELLSENQRTAILLRDWEKYTYEEIAIIMGVELHIVKNNIWRARKHLRKYIVSPDKVI
jgi:RNA polymerase sigma factor (sigma-70 family)